MILVDDASKDRTFEVAQELGIQCYRNPVNLGYGGNLKRALALAEKLGMDIIIDLHPDDEYDSSAIPLALEEIRKGADFVLGNRFTKVTDQFKTGMYIWKIFPILFLNYTARLILGVKINDLHQGFRVYTRNMLKHLNYQENSNGYLFSFELIAQAVHADLKIAQVPVRTHYSGKKRGANLIPSIIYTLGVLKSLSLFMVAKIGFRTQLFRRVGLPLSKV